MGLEFEGESETDGRREVIRSSGLFQHTDPLSLDLVISSSSTTSSIPSYTLIDSPDAPIFV